MQNYVPALFAKLGMERRTQAAANAVRAFDDQHADRGAVGPGRDPGLVVGDQHSLGKVLGRRSGLRR